MTSRAVLGGVAAAAVIAATIGGVAVANPSSAPPSTGATTPGSSKGPGVEALPNLAHAAAELGVSPDRLLHALPAAKLATREGGSISGAAAAAALAAALGVSPARAQRALLTLFGAEVPGTGIKTGTAQPPDSVIASLASQLHVSAARAGDVFDALSRMSNPGHGVDPTSPAFTALANSLGMSPAQLAQNLEAWKMSLRSTMPRSPSPSPQVPRPSAS